MIYLIIGVIIVDVLFACYAVNRLNRIEKQAEERMSLWDQQGDINDRVVKSLKDAATLIGDMYKMIVEDDGK